MLIELRNTAQELSPTHTLAPRAWCIAFVTLAVCMSVAAQDAPDGAPFRFEYVIARERTRLISSGEEERFDAVVRLGALSRPESARVAAIGLTDTSARVRAAAVNAVGRLPASELAEKLAVALGDKNEFVRQQAAYAAGVLEGNQIIAQQLIGLLRTDKSSAVRGAAAVALGDLGNATAVSGLLEVLNRTQRAGGIFNRVRRRRTPENEFVRRAAIVALGKIGDRRAVSALISQVTNEKAEDDVRREAARALGLIGDDSARQALQSVLTARDPYLANIAVDALRRLERGT